MLHFHGSVRASHTAYRLTSVHCGNLPAAGHWPTPIVKPFDHGPVNRGKAVSRAGFGCGASADGRLAEPACGPRVSSDVHRMLSTSRSGTVRSPAGPPTVALRSPSTATATSLSRYDGLRAVRLNALGAYVLGLTDGYEAASTNDQALRTLKVLPNLGRRGNWGPATGRPADAGRLRGAGRRRCMRRRGSCPAERDRLPRARRLPVLTERATPWRRSDGPDTAGAQQTVQPASQ